MSKTKTALPERRYYRLTDAAIFLGCSVDDLLHFGVCGYLEILAAVSEVWAQCFEFEAERFIYIEGGEVGDCDFVVPLLRDLLQVEKSGKVVIGDARAVYCFYNGEIKMCLPEKSSQDDLLKPFDHDLPDYLFRLNRRLDAESSTTSTVETENGVEISPDRFWIRTEELRRFQKEGANHVRTDPPTPLPSNKSAATRSSNTQLVIIAALCKKLGIDPNERGAATRISDMTALVGEKLDSETTGKYLRKINDVVDFL